MLKTLLPLAETASPQQLLRQIQQEKETLQAIVEGTSAVTGDAFFHSLVQQMATVLQVAYAFVAQLDAGNNRVRTIALWAKDKFVDNVEYGLTGTPCQEVVGGQVCTYTHNVQKLFPLDTGLVTLAVESYLGIPLFASNGRVLGHLAVLDTKPMSDENRFRSILQIFAARAGGELERQLAQEALNQRVADLEVMAQENARLYREHERLSTILEATTDLVGLADTHGQILYLNQAGRRMLGIGVDEPLIQMRVPDYHAPSVRERLMQEIIPGVVEQGVWSGETVMLNRNGREIAASQVLMSHKTADGRPEYFSTIVRDISERKQTEAAIRAVVGGTVAVTGTDFFKSLVRHMATALNMRYAFVAELNESGNRVRTLAFWDDINYRDNIEYALVGTPCYDVIGGETCAYQQNVQHLFPLDLDLVALNAESYIGVPLQNSQGNIMGHLAVLDTQPLQDRKQQEAILKIFAARAGAEMERQLNEEALAKRAVELETAVQVSTAATTILNLDRLLQSVVNLTRSSFNLYHVHIYLLNETGDALELVAGSDEIGQRMKADGWRICLETADSLVAQVARTHQGIILNNVAEAPHFLPNPLLPDTRAELAVPMIIGQKLLGVLDVQSRTINRFTAEDVHIQTILAAQIAVAIRNAHLFEETSIARHKAEQANQYKSQFLTTMSHELRTPLNAIINFAGFVADGLMGSVNEQQQAYLQKTVESGEHLLSLINDVLDLAKIEAGLMNVYMEEINMNTAIHNVMVTAKGLLKEKPVALESNVLENLPIIIGDKRRIRQILLNLVANAVKYTLEGEIEVSAQPEAGGIHIAIRDSGIGIAPDDQELVFQSFGENLHHLENVTSSGLGLPITRQLVELHNGRIWFNSSEGVGSTFHVWLPCQQPQPLEQPYAS